MAATLLPSQRTKAVYVGPQGQLEWQAPTDKELGVLSEDSDDDDSGSRGRVAVAGSPLKAARARANRVRAAEQVADHQAELARAAAKFRASMAAAQHGISATRTEEAEGAEFASKLSQRLAATRLAASRLAGPCLVDALDETMQREILAHLDIPAAAVAAMACQAWRQEPTHTCIHAYTHAHMRTCALTHLRTFTHADVARGARR